MLDRIHVEVAWETDPLTRPADEDWTRLGTVDPSLKVESLSTSRGVNIRTGKIETGQATAKIGDQNGNLDPSNVASEWAPNVLPRRRIRFVVDPVPLKPGLLTWGTDPLVWDGELLMWSFEDPGETVLWTGYIQSVPIQWRRAVQWTSLSAAGIFWLLADTSLPTSVLHAETMALEPAVYWPLTEQSGGLVAEDVAGLLDGSYRLDPKPATIVPYAPGGQTFASFNQEDKQTQHVEASSLAMSADWTWAAWFMADTNYPQDSELAGSVFNAEIVAVDPQGLGAGALTVSVITQADNRGTVEVFYGGGNFRFVRSTVANLLDGRPHLVTVQGDSGEVTLYVDGVDVTSLVADEGTPSPPSGQVIIGALPSWETEPGLMSVFPLRWRVGHVAYWDRLLTNNEVAGLYSAGVEAWAGDLTGARLHRILDLAGVDADDRDIATGTQTCGPTLLNGENVMAYIEQIAATEGGPVGEDSEGRVFLRDRIANNPALVATFSDDPDGDSGSAVAPLDPDFSLDRVINIARVTRESGVTQEATAPVSLTTFGPKTVSIETLHQSPSGSRATASRLTIRNSQPRLVFPSVQADSIDTPADVLTDSDIGDAVEVIARPPRGGDPIEQTSIVERIEHACQARESWKTTFGVVEHTVLPDFWWDEPGQGWDESVWVAP